MTTDALIAAVDQMHLFDHASSTTPLQIPHILRLPNEIIETIISEASRIMQRRGAPKFLGWAYPEHEAQQLRSLALTCRRFYVLCAPYLWRDKEFILPREDDEKLQEQEDVQMATDILSRQQTILKQPFGCFVRSLCRDLSNGPHYNMNNSRLMAQLVCNLRALRIDFHPKARAEHYGLSFFIEHCPQLNELYLENCRDTYNDFHSLVRCERRLTSLTLLCCTIKQSTLNGIAQLCKRTLRRLMLQRVLIEPGDPDTHDSHNMTSATMTVSHVLPIPMPCYTQLLYHQQLTQLALSDPLSYSLIELIVRGSPQLSRLAIIVRETDPVCCTHALLLLGELKELHVLSLAFRNVHPLSTAYERLPCRAISSAWHYFADRLPQLQLIHVSASQLLLPADFFTRLLDSHPYLSHIMFHHIAYITNNAFEEYPAANDNNTPSISTIYRNELAHANNGIDAWKHDPGFEKHFLSFDQAYARGFRCFDENDNVCFVKGFEDWIRLD